MIDTLSSQYDADRPRARKGYTRAMLCHVINMLLKNKMIELKDKVELIAGNIGGIKGGKQHNLINLVKMYENMGFVQYAQTKNQRNLESTVEKVLKWCDDKYNIKQKPKQKPKPKKEEAGPAEDDELKINVKPKINVKLLSARARVKTLKQQIKELREEGKTSKRIEKEIRIEELKLSKMEKQKKLKEKQNEEAGPAEEDDDDEYVFKPFSITVDGKKKNIKKLTPKEKEQDEKTLKTRTDRQFKMTKIKIGTVILKIAKETNKDNVRATENDVLADPHILATNHEEKVLREFALRRYKELEDGQTKTALMPTKYIDRLNL